MTSTLVTLLNPLDMLTQQNSVMTVSNGTIIGSGTGLADLVTTGPMFAL